MSVMENRSQILYNSLLKYYTPEKLKMLVNITQNINENEEHPSLRLIDWLVTNYSKKHNVIYYLHSKPFNLHQNYKNMLKAYSKKLFDPFRRHSRVKIQCDFLPEGYLETTVAQLTFFKWAIDCQVLSYAQDNKSHIKKDMDCNRQVGCEESNKKSVPKSAKIVNINFNVTFS